ncbi:amidohydrolase family protein [Actinoallomurus iriomotensis]|uniref:Amidohydrolase n=1 Tax=Actinoallomurus iriomotensis TaxID=478107 RepID=A0A9W6RT85_9ACTN|nr:amidohydrolase family protein [Actinoallomurus iriomotensis]GLY82136.1 amidohydrolase [Actinoallomurus iriomotensis]
MRNGRITEIMYGRFDDGRTPHDERDVIRVDRGVLCPGLIDLHAHITLPADGSVEVPRVSPTLDGETRSGHEVLRAMARAGITTVRDCGGDADLIFRISARPRTDEARLITCGAPLTPIGGHGADFGAAVRDAPEIRATVARFAERGARFIKIMGSGGGSNGTHPSDPSFSAPLLREAVCAANHHGLLSTVHCLSAESMRLAAGAGTSMIEHAKFRTRAEDGTGFDPAVAELLAERGVDVTATMSVGAHVLAQPPEVSGEAGITWRRRHEQDMRDMSRLIEAGVSVLAGTDAGWRFTPFDALAGEVALLAECGMSRARAYAAATTEPARALGRAGDIGRLAEGTYADMVLYDDDPLNDLRVLHHPRLVFAGGMRIEL